MSNVQFDQQLLFLFPAWCTFFCVVLEGVKKIKWMVAHSLCESPVLSKILDYQQTGGWTLISGAVISSVQTTNGNPEYEVFSFWSSKNGTVPAAPKSPWQKKKPHLQSNLYLKLDKISLVVNCSFLCLWAH